MESYKEQKGRGTDGFGFLELNEDELQLHRFVYEVDALKGLADSKAPEILFHHRWPTSNINSAKSNHPIMSDSDVYQYNYYMIHNGHITNHFELKEAHNKLGIAYNTMVDDKTNDSESLLHELALVIEEKKEYKDFAAKGSMAFVMVQTSKLNIPVALYYGKGWSSDLTKNEDENILEIKSIGGKDMVTANILFRFDYETHETTQKELELSYRSYSTYHSNINHNRKDTLISIVNDIMEDRTTLDWEVKDLSFMDKRMLAMNVLCRLKQLDIIYERYLGHKDFVGANSVGDVMNIHQETLKLLKYDKQ